MKNKALAALEPLIGQWEYTMYNAWFLESMDTKVKGFTTIERLHDSFVIIRGKRLFFWREDEDFYQRMTIEIKSDGLHSVAEASEDKGKTWRKDLEMTHKRLE